jgi:hypothetical protein
MAGNMPEPSHTGKKTGSMGTDTTMSSSSEFTVDKIEHVAATCPANWNKSVNTGNWNSDTKR